MHINMLVTKSKPLKDMCQDMVSVWSKGVCMPLLVSPKMMPVYETNKIRFYSTKF